MYFFNTFYYKRYVFLCFLCFIIILVRHTWLLLDFHNIVFSTSPQPIKNTCFSYTLNLFFVFTWCVYNIHNLLIFFIINAFTSDSTNEKHFSSRLLLRILKLINDRLQHLHKFYCQ